jgi:hypothetical protein
MLPQRRANNGMAVPISVAPIVPKNMRSLSVASANLKSWRKETVFSYVSGFLSSIRTAAVSSSLASEGSSSGRMLMIRNQLISIK